VTMLVKLRTADGRLVNIPRYVGRREQAWYSLWPTGHDQLFHGSIAVKRGTAAGHQVCVFHHRRQDGRRGRPSGVRFHHRHQDTGDRQLVAIAVLTRRDMHKAASSPSAVNRFWPDRTIERLIRRLKTHPDRCRTGQVRNT
jgi:hypothetical protein